MKLNQQIKIKKNAYKQEFSCLKYIKKETVNSRFFFIINKNKYEFETLLYNWFLR